MNQPDRDGVEHRDASGLGGRHDAAVDAAQDDHRHHQRGEGVGAAFRRLAGEFLRRRLHLDVLLPRHQHQVERTQEKDEDQARNHRGEEALQHRLARHPGIDDLDRARRDEQTQRRRIGDQRRREALGIIGRSEPGQQHRADAGERRRRAAGDRAEDGAGDDGGGRHPAAHAADEEFRQIHHGHGDPALLHDAAGHDEERDGQQHQVVHAPVTRGHEGHRVRVGEDREVDHHRAEGEGHGQPDHQHHAEQDQGAEQHHGASPRASWLAGAAPGERPSRRTKCIAE